MAMATYAELRKLGIGQLERLASEQWTDFNSHDPGITILEALCYVLTDLGYRTGHDIADLLADEGADPYASLHPASEILTTRAVTANDLRRLVLDVEGVKNAWIETIDERLPGTDVALRGLYRVAIELSPEREGVAVRREVGRRINKNRGLCEDMVEIVVLEPFKVGIDARVEIGRVDEPSLTYAQILEAIAEIISPTVRFSTLDECLEKGMRVDEIFDGPLLDHGFITEDALSNARRHVALHSSDLVHAIMDVPGIRSVTEIVMHAGEARDTWSIELPKDCAPQLDRAASKITLLNAGMPVAVGNVPPAAPWQSRGQRGDLTPPRTRNRNVRRYHSLQHHLPMVYGVGEVGLPESASNERKGLAKQLKAYLMFFDQLMANHLAQLAHIKDLFSIHAGTENEQTYFAQYVDEPALGLDEIAPNTLDVKLETPDAAIARKHRFLNHLLARFAENLNDRYSAAEADSLALIQHKQTFLEKYPRISSSRGTALDGLVPWGMATPSGLEERIRFKLGLIEGTAQDSAQNEQSGRDEPMIMIEHIHLRPGQIPVFEAANQLCIGSSASATVKDRYSLKLSFVFPKFMGRFRSAPFRTLVEQTVRSQAPAHIGTYVHWLDEGPWKSFRADYDTWMKGRREQFAMILGISMGLDATRPAAIAPTPMAYGTTSPARAFPWLIEYGSSAHIAVEGSQGGAAYALRSTEGQPYSRSVEGTANTIVLESFAMVENATLRVDVTRASDLAIQLDAEFALEVTANPKLGVSVDATIVDAGSAATIRVSNTQRDVQYALCTKSITDRELITTPPPTPGANTAMIEITPVPAQPWENGYAQVGAFSSGNGGTLELRLSDMREDSQIVVRARKTHHHVSDGEVFSDMPLEKKVAIFVRPGPATNLTLEATGPKSILVTGGEVGVLYYLFDPVTKKLLGKPAYFQRQDQTNSSVNFGIGDMRIGRDLVVAQGPVAEGANRSTTKPLDPIISVDSIPTNGVVQVLAVRARTGVAWSTAQTRSIINA